MLFSIITPVYNGDIFIDGYLNCLRGQDFCDWEAIIVDDSSTDGTFNTLERLTKNDPRFLLLQNSNTENKKIPGPYQARNLALKNARGKFICFLDIDDKWPRNRLSKYRSILINESNIDIIYSDYVCHDAHKKTVFCVKQPPFISPKIIVHFANPIPMLTACIRRSVAINHAFSPIHHEDYLYWRNIILDMQDSSIRHVSEPLAIYGVHKSSLTANKFLSFYWLYKAFIFSSVRYVYLPFYLLGNILFHLVRFVYSRSSSFEGGI